MWVNQYWYEPDIKFYQPCAYGETPTTSKTTCKETPTKCITQYEIYNGLDYIGCISAYSVEHDGNIIKFLDVNNKMIGSCPSTYMVK